MSRVLIFLICVVSIAISGCTTMAVPVVKESLRCEAPADMLAACGDAAAIRQGITFGEMIDVSSRDRDTLKECALRQKKLAEVITECKTSIDKYNAAIQEMNARNAKQ